MNLIKFNHVAGMTVARATKNIGFTVPPSMAEEFEEVAKEEQSTKSELFRRMFRFYKAARRPRGKQGADFNAWIDKVIFDALEEKRTSPMSDEALADLEHAVFVATRSTPFSNMSEEEIDRIVYEERKTRRQANRT
jgi:Ribbon-helix-helix protein, copG family